MRAVILGSSGFVGRALERQLTESGYAVQGYSSKALDLARAENLTTLDAVVTPDTVLFFVASMTPDRGVNPRTMCANALMGANLASYLEASSRRPLKVVHISTDAVYPADVERVDEATPVSPESYYAVGKFAAEGALRACARTTATPLLVLRPTGLFGLGDPHGSYGPNRFIRTLLAERNVKLFGEGSELRDHLYLDDFVRITVRLTLSEATGIVNVASGTSRSFQSIVDDLRQIVPYEFELIRAPRTGAVTHRHYDVTRLRSLTPDLEPTPFRTALEAVFVAASRTASSDPQRR
jgi:UDP-glucose 4-epimerase